MAERFGVQDPRWRAHQFVAYYTSSIGSRNVGMYDGIVARARTPYKSADATLSESSPTVLILIGSFKLVKALLLVAVGFGALHFLHRDLAGAILHSIQVLRVDPDNEFVHRILVAVFRVTPKQLRELSVGTFLYAALFATEGVGLLLRKRWAEYFTIITTGALIPLEVFEMSRHFTVTKVVVTVVNALIVWYLVARVRAHREPRQEWAAEERLR